MLNSQHEETMGGPSDEELALALQGGDAQAFEELVRRFQGRVYAVAYRMTSNREEALDITQDALFKAYRKIDSWQPTGAFGAWLLRLTTNTSLDFLRRKKRRRTERYTDAIGDGGDTAASPERAARNVEIDERVTEALEVLSPAQRTVFVLRHYEGMPLAEIAPVLGCTVGSVKVHLFRALKKLRQELDDLWDDEG